MLKLFPTDMKPSGRERSMSFDAASIVRATNLGEAKRFSSCPLP